MKNETINISTFRCTSININFFSPIEKSYKLYIGKRKLISNRYFILIKKKKHKNLY